MVQISDCMCEKVQSAHLRCHKIACWPLYLRIFDLISITGDSLQFSELLGNFQYLLKLFRDWVKSKSMIRVTKDKRSKVMYTWNWSEQLSRTTQILSIPCLIGMMTIRCCIPAEIEKAVTHDIIHSHFEGRFPFAYISHWFSFEFWGIQHSTIVVCQTKLLEVLMCYMKINPFASVSEKSFCRQTYRKLRFQCVMPLMKALSSSNPYLSRLHKTLFHIQDRSLIHSYWQ